MPRIPYGTKYTVQSSGYIWKPVTCENCGCEYVYRIQHRTSGTATNPLWLNKQGAITKAEDRAQANLEKYLKNASHDYPCPNCGFFQAKAIQHKKNDIWLKGLVFGLLAFLLTIMVFSENTMAILFGLGAGVIVSILSLGKLSNFNPNADANTRINQKFSEQYPVLRKSEFDLVRSQQ
ncbi:MAG TPA: hypothetical protein PKX08_19225 [Cyclobacteriaceae bacterium]|nr:hypothetical protein [Cyclobacteriaceae bacterium]